MSRRPKSIFRCETRPHGFVTIDRRTLEGDSLSLAARGLLGYLLAKPDDWEVSVTDVRRRGNLGRTKAYRLVEELIEAGYLTPSQERVQRGRFTRTVYSVYERPRRDLREALGPVPVTSVTKKRETNPRRPVDKTQPYTNGTNYSDQQLPSETKRSGCLQPAYLAAEAIVPRLRAASDEKRARQADTPKETGAGPRRKQST